MYPLGYRILIEPEDLEEKTEGGIVIPDTIRDKERLATQTGKVVAVGKQAWSEDEQAWAEVGDRVMFGKYAQKRIKDPDTDKEYVLVNDQDLIAIL